MNINHLTNVKEESQFLVSQKELNRNQIAIGLYLRLNACCLATRLMISQWRSKYRKLGSCAWVTTTGTEGLATRAI
jgi:hypothetical protein